MSPPYHFRNGFTILPSATRIEQRWQRRRLPPAPLVRELLKCRLIIVPNDDLETAASLEAFPVFDDSPSPPHSPPLPPLLRPPRRRSRQVNEVDRRVLFGSNKPNVFTYVDLVRCLRCPPAPGYLPRAPQSQLGTHSTYTRSSQLSSFSPAPWALSESQSQAPPDSSGPQAQTSGSRRRRTASISLNTT